MPARPPAAPPFSPTSCVSACAKEDFLAVIDGMDMDVDEDIARPDWRRSISIATGWPPRWAGCRSRFSAWTRDPGFALAHHLGRALQLTNILRDIDEDAALGRLYLPREELDDAGIESTIRARWWPIRASTRCAAGGRLAHEHYRAADA